MSGGSGSSVGDQEVLVLSCRVRAEAGETAVETVEGELPVGATALIQSARSYCGTNRRLDTVCSVATGEATVLAAYS